MWRPRCAAPFLTFSVLTSLSRPSAGAEGSCAAGGAEGSCVNTALLADHLERLQAGDCNFGTLKEPRPVLAVDYSEFKTLRLPGKLLCPIIITGFEKSDGWKDVIEKNTQLDELQRRTADWVNFDSSKTGNFAYWDNNSLLSASVRDVGRAGQNFLKVDGSKKDFFKALLSEKPFKPLHYVRYGGNLGLWSPQFSKAMGTWLSDNSPFGSAEVNPLLWLSSADSFSTAHYDSFHNLFIQFVGEKKVLLAPPSDAYHFRLYPGTHPLARQARLHFGAIPDGKKGKKVQLPDERAKMLVATISPGMAVFIPSHWMHHVHAVTTSVSLAMTTLPQFHFDFNSWVTDVKAIAPFLTDDSDGIWTVERMVAGFLAFVPKLMEALGFEDPTAPNDPLNVLSNSSYGLEARREMGMPDKLPSFGTCPRPSKKDVKVAQKAALKVAKTFKSTHQEDLIQIYLLPYFETLLSKVAAGESDIPRIMTVTMGFIEDCLKPVRLQRAAKRARKASAESVEE